MVFFRSIALVFVWLLAADPAFAQNWSFDARQVSLGAVGAGDNPASRMIEDERGYKSIVVPLGLLQLIGDIDKMNPGNDQFDFGLAIEYAASPLHYTFGRGAESNTGRDLIVDIRNATLSRDLNDYKGFLPVNQAAAEGLSSSSYGKTFKVVQGPRGAFQGVYVGAGPYLSMRAAPVLDERLVNILHSDQRVIVPNARLTVNMATQGQAAMAITGGYRARFALPQGTSDRDGLYVAANYNYLRGFRYEDLTLGMALETDQNGLVTIRSPFDVPLSVSRRRSSKGTGMAVDLGVGIVLGGIEAGFGASGLGNHITWTDADLASYAMQNLLLGNDAFVKSGPAVQPDQRVELPVNYTGNIGYHIGPARVVAEFGRGYQGNTVRSGAEYRLGMLEFRGGGVYSREVWNPTGGIGFNLGGRVWLDAAMFGNIANIERKRKPALAVSLRLNH